MTTQRRTAISLLGAVFLLFMARGLVMGSLPPVEDASKAGFSTTGKMASVAQLTTMPVTTYFVYLPLVESHEYVSLGLENGGFEAEWEDERSYSCLIFYTDGTVEATVRGNILTPPGWLTWYKHGKPVEHDPENQDGWQQPEVKDARHTDPDRMHSGVKGQMMFKNWGVLDGGLLQQVQATPGDRLRLSGWAHAWSNNGEDSEHPSDPRWSEGSHVGYNAFFAPEGTDRLDNADRNFTFWLGLDPTGGIDPYADTVVWGTGAHIYNAYHEVPTVSASAASPTVTVFLRAKTLWRFKHNDAYWDDIELEVWR